MNTNDLINECIKVYNGQTKVCMHTWKNLPPDIVYKIESNMSECVQFLRTYISNCKYEEDCDGTKSITLRNPHCFEQYAKLSIRNERDRLCLDYYYSTSDYIGFSFSYDIDFVDESTMIWWMNMNDKIAHSYVNDELLR